MVQFDDAEIYRKHAAELNCCERVGRPERRGGSVGVGGRAGDGLTALAGGREQRAYLFKAISRLSVRQRAVVFLTYWSDLEPSSVGELLGVSQRTVERELTNARRHLERILT